MRVRKLLVMAMLTFPMVGMAQSTYEQIGTSTDDAVQLENMSVNPTYQQWLGQYEEVGQKINDISEQYQKEVNKRGYPKKKTVQKKIELVSQYISLLTQERDMPELNQNLDVKKVNRKITLWQDQLEGLTRLLKKI